MLSFLRKHRRKIFWAFVGPLLGLFLFLFLLLNSGLIQTPLVNLGLFFLGRKLEREIRVDSFKLSLIGGYLEIRDVYFGNPEGFRSPETGKLERLTVRWKYLPLFQKKVVVELVEIVHPEFTLEMDPDKKLNITNKHPKPDDPDPDTPEWRARMQQRANAVKAFLDFDGNASIASLPDMPPQGLAVFQPLRDDGTPKKSPEDILQMFFEWLTIENLRLIGASYHMYLDMVPLTLQSPEINLAVNWLPEQGEYAISIDIPKVEMDIVNKVFVRNASVSGKRIFWHRHGWRVEEFDVYEGGKAVHLHVPYADVRHVQVPLVNAQASITVKAREALNVVPLIPVNIDGTVTIDAKMRMAKGDFRIFSDMKGKNIVGWRTHSDWMRCKAEVSKYDVKVPLLALEAYGGEIRGDGIVHFGGPQQKGLWFKGQARDIDLPETLKMVGLAGSPSAKVAADFNFTLPGFHPSEMIIRGNVTANGKAFAKEAPPRPPLLPQPSPPFTLSVAVGMDGMKAWLKDGNIQAGSTQLAMAGSVDLTGKILDIGALLVSGDINELARMGDQFLGHEETQLQSGAEPLSNLVEKGALKAELKLAGSFNDLKAQGTVSLSEARLAKQTIGSLKGDVSLEGTILSVKNITVKEQKTNVIGDFQMDLAPRLPEALQAPGEVAGPDTIMGNLYRFLTRMPAMTMPLTLTPLDLGKTLAPYLPPLAGLGQLMGQVHLATGGLAPQGDLELTLKGSHLFDQPMDTVSLLGKLNPQGVTIHNIIDFPFLKGITFQANAGFDDRLDATLTTPVFDQNAVKALSGLTLPMMFQAQVTANASQTLTHPLASAAMDFNHLSLGAIDLVSGKVEAHLKNQAVEVTARLFEDRVEARLQIPSLLKLDYNLIVEFRDIDFADILPKLLPDFQGEIGGRMTATVHASGNLREVLKSLVQVRISQLELQSMGASFALKQTLAATYSLGRLEVHPFTLSGTLGSLTMQGALTEDKGSDFTFSAQIELVQAAKFFSFLKEADGTLSIEGHISGQTSTPKLEAECTLDLPKLALGFLPEDPLKAKGSWKISTQPLPLFHQGDSQSSKSRLVEVLESTQIYVHRLEASWLGLDATLQGALRVPKDHPLTLELNGGLGFLPKLVSAVPWAEGTINLKVQVKGSILNPWFKGSASVHGDTLRINGLPLALANIDAKVGLDGDTITIDSLAGRAARGLITASGEFKLTSYVPQYVDLKLKLENVSLTLPEKVYTTLNASLRITGEFMAPLIDGKVELLRCRYAKDISYNAILLDTGSQLVFSREHAPVRRAIPIKPEFDIQIQAPGTITVKNNMADMSIGASLQLRGSLQKPLLFGRAEIIKGTMIFQERTFTLENGALDFLDPYRINPGVNITAKSTIQQYEITLSVSGNVLDHLEVGVTSEPPLDTIAIYSLILSGQTSLGGSGEGANASSIAAGLIANQIESSAKYIGIDEFALDPSISEQTTRLTFGKNVTENLKVLVSTEIPSQRGQTLILKYNVTENVLLVGERDSGGSYGGDIRFRFEFR